MRCRALVPLVFFSIGIGALWSGEAEAPGPGAPLVPGEVVAYGIGGVRGKEDVIAKGLAISVGGDATMCFDTDSLSWSGWRGGFLDRSVTNAARTAQGKAVAPSMGETVFHTGTGPGWVGPNGDVGDPRASGRGRLPESWGAYLGCHRHGGQVVVRYRVGQTEVLEVPGAVLVDDQVMLTRTIQVGPGPAQSVLLVDTPYPERSPNVPPDAERYRLPAAGALAQVQGVGGDPVTVRVSRDLPPAVMIATDRGRIELELPARTEPLRFVVGLWSGQPPLPVLRGLSHDVALVPAEVDQLTRPAAARWPAVTTHGVLGKDEAAYVVDTITLPNGASGDPLLRPSGLDFLPDGTAMLCTLGGEVWQVGGLSNDLAGVRWKRFAAGLYEPLGLVVVDGAVLVTCRDRVVRLRDLDHDGEADAYDNFHNLGESYDDYHDFVFDLARGADGDLYLARGGNRVPWYFADHSAVLRIAKDGSSHTVVATGFRAPNGLGVGPQGQLTVSDNQGHWTPASKINLIRPGGSYGYVADPRVKGNDQAKVPQRFDPPLCWIPMAIDNSSASQVWVPDDRWGPLAGSLLHLSYGKSTLMVVPHGSVGDVAQGGVVTLPLKFASGIMRARFNPADGQLYVCGLKGWQTNAGKDGCFQRVRWTGKPFAAPIRMQVVKDAIVLEFSAPLAVDTVTADSVTAQRWNYQWSATYGSPDVRPDGKPGRETVEITRVALSGEGRVVTITMPGLSPVMQLAVKYRFESAAGEPVMQELAATINAVP